MRKWGDSKKWKGIKDNKKLSDSNFNKFDS